MMLFYLIPFYTFTVPQIVFSWFFFILSIIMMLFFHREALIEEEYCQKIFGEEYKEYIKNTPRWIGFTKSEKENNLHYTIQLMMLQSWQ